MNLKEFIKEVLLDIDGAVIEVNKENIHRAYFVEGENKRTIEFDIAVSTEEINSKKGKAGIKVLQFAEAGGGLSRENKNSTVSRIAFGVNLESMSKEEKAKCEF